jgi:hypothetical protein
MKAMRKKNATFREIGAALNVPYKTWEWRRWSSPAFSTSVSLKRRLPRSKPETAAGGP